MRVVIAGGHGQIALRLELLLADVGHQAVGLVRNPDHTRDVQTTGAEAVVLDLEAASLDEVVETVAGADAALFAAGAGPGSGPARKDTVDRAASVLLADACERAGIRRLVQISSIGASPSPPANTDAVFAAYLQAKWAAEEDLRSRDLDWTVLRPGRLTNEPGVGRVHLADSVPRGSISRDDVAAVILALLTESAGVGRTLTLVEGDVPITQAIEHLANSGN